MMTLRNYADEPSDPENRKTAAPTAQRFSSTSVYRDRSATPRGTMRQNSLLSTGKQRFYAKPPNYLDQVEQNPNEGR
jgi:hypothetical protein